MAQGINVGHIDGIIRIFLGVVCLGFVGYHFLANPILPLYAIILMVILIPYFLKTGLTRKCPIMKAMNVSTAGTKSTEGEMS